MQLFILAHYNNNGTMFILNICGPLLFKLYPDSMKGHQFSNVNWPITSFQNENMLLITSNANGTGPDNFIQSSLGLFHLLHNAN